MRLQNVLIATKQTELEHFRQKYDRPSEVLSPTVLERKKREHEEHYASFNHIKMILDKKNISYQRAYMPYGAYEEFEGRDLIISVGGDGTVLNSAHYILDKTPILTVKSERDSKGALCSINASQFEEAVDNILSGNYSTESWTRVEGKFGRKKKLALNEIFVGKKYSGQTARYEVKYHGALEEQKSSGIIVSSGAGSTAWYHNVEHSIEKFDPKELELRFVVSEEDKDANYKLLHGYLFSGDIIEITSLMDIDGVIRFDGDNDKRSYEFPIGKKVYIGISDKPLNVIVMDGKK